MDGLFPGRKRFMRQDEGGNITEQWFSEHLDWKAKVVCKGCNEGWMSDVENLHAKSAMADLILGKLDVPISRQRASSIALFAFKSAVVLDHVARGREPFFLRSMRHSFREHLVIPPTTVQMWMAGFLPHGKGEVFTCCHEGSLSPSNWLKMYVCTYAVGRLTFQLVAQRQQGFTVFGPRERKFDGLAVPFFPTGSLPNNFTWPAGDVLRTASDLEEFAVRWRELRILK